MYVTAIFESWHIGDGTYPPLHMGQHVNLSFEVDRLEMAKTDSTAAALFESRSDASCAFVAHVLKLYEAGGETIAVLDAGAFRFYIHGPKAASVAAGDRVQGRGTLALDHYMWVEFLDRYADLPDLFYNLEVRRIRRVRIPERLIRRYAGGKTMPTTAAPGEYSEQDVQELETMAGQEFDEEFYIIDFDSEGLENERLARTFL
jgi:hypothetical protein